MSKLDLTLKDPVVANDKLTGTLVASGDLNGTDFKHELPVDVASTWEGDLPIPIPGCELHLSVGLENPRRICVDGHLQCGDARVPTQKAYCHDF